ncbi:fungal-specific transcription factor domain-domain-containing protein [Kockovaella imperatae]|uniref:Fungal-specific transcription factor domain-domain-containing protein n=1 Tax=Kockovaella imperatae TaxID=4999 RepID=A0A1Y1UKV8_9TREE|nr:fungal-specific transcription factor domain-domain-containing protein [Kockovaella imperatae]ORX38629.1 fungal-specific transcription factor domain-domain-containing protein [Kockovaella imperatae]
MQETLRYLPKKSSCDRYIVAFFSAYNEYVDIIYEPDFRAKYEAFWTVVVQPNPRPNVELRFLALLLIVLAFGVLLDYNQDTSLLDGLGVYNDDVRRNFERMLNESRDESFGLADREELSHVLSRAANRALAEASTFHEPSLDSVTAKIMLSLYYVICRRVFEGWTMIGEAVRAAQAQGMHVDPSIWDMPPLQAEIRRRLWAHMYTLDRSLALYVGRPFAVVSEYTTRPPVNATDQSIASASHQDNIIIATLDNPTKSTFLILHYQLAKIIGEAQEKCFGISGKRRYKDVLDCEELFDAFKRSLPPHFRLDGDEADHSLDLSDEYKWLVPQRLSLISKYHLARISLHRPYLLRSFRHRGDTMFAKSREACIESSVAEIQLRTALEGSDPLDRFKWMTVASGFNTATILGCLCIFPMRGDGDFDQRSVLQLLEKYVSIQEKTLRRDERLEDELRVLRMMLQRAKINMSIPKFNHRARHSSAVEPTPITISRGLDPQLGNARVTTDRKCTPIFSFCLPRPDLSVTSTTTHNHISSRSSQTDQTLAPAFQPDTQDDPALSPLRPHDPSSSVPSTSGQMTGSPQVTPLTDIWDLGAEQYPLDAEAWLNLFAQYPQHDQSSDLFFGLMGMGTTTTEEGWMQHGQQDPDPQSQADVPVCTASNERRFGGIPAFGLESGAGGSRSSCASRPATR